MSRHGAKKKPFYRIVVSDQRFPRDGRYIEQVGTYDPRLKNGVIKLDREKIDAWIKKGAKPSQTVSELIKKELKAS
jgi:small subunit ribosomal protein S16